MFDDLRLFVGLLIIALLGAGPILFMVSIMMEDDKEHAEFMNWWRERDRLDTQEVDKKVRDI